MLLVVNGSLQKNNDFFHVNVKTCIYRYKYTIMSFSPKSESAKTIMSEKVEFCFSEHVW